MPAPHVHRINIVDRDGSFRLVCADCNVETGRCRTCAEWFDIGLLTHSNDRYYCPTCMAAWPSCARCSSRAEGFNRVLAGAVACESCWQAMNPRCSACTVRFTRTTDESLCPSCTTSRHILANPTFTRLTEHRKVGIEIEFVTSASHRPKWGTIKGDGSVGPLSDVPYPHLRWSGAEFASFPVRGDQVLDAIHETCAALSPTSYVNRSCGLHIHLDITDTSDLGRRRVADWWRIYEPIFFATVAPARRSTSYCKPVGSTPYVDWDHDRYVALNITSYRKHSTYEFRLHHGSLDPLEIEEWVRFLLAFVRTHKDIPIDATLTTDLKKLTHRQLLIVMFNQMALPLMLRKAIVSRIVKHDHVHGRSQHLRKFRGTALDLRKDLDV